MARAPGYTHWVPLPYGAFKAVLQDPPCFLLQAREQFGDVVRFRIGPLLVHFLFHPDHVQHVLHDHQKNYPRGWQYRLLRRLLGNNLVVSDGEFWLRQRRLAQPAFHRQRLTAYAPVMVETTSEMVGRWEEVATAGKPLDIAPEMSRLALAIAGRTLFSRDVSGEADAVGTSFRILSLHLQQRFNHPVAPPLWVPSTGNRRFKEALSTLNGIVLSLIQERRQESNEKNDLLAMLMQARDEETGEVMTNEELRSEVLDFLIAGHETTATALTWTWFLLGSHPEIQQRVRGEVQTVIGERVPSPDDAPRLVFTRRVIEESMRLYPPIWAVTREAARDDEIGGFRIPAGSTVLLSPFVTQRHPAIWEKPDVFDPDRFAPERHAQRSKYAYFPFLGGPHQCIGNEFAMLEMCLVVAAVLQKFHLELIPGEAVSPIASLTLRPNSPVRVTLQRSSNVPQTAPAGV